MMREVYFVCTGNTCRSPMAMAIANKYFTDNGLPLVAHSRGVFAARSVASANAIALMKRLGSDLSGHVSMPLSEGDVQRAYRVIALTASHKDEILRRHKGAAHKVYTLGELAETFEDVHDPFGGDPDVYEQCANQINRLLNIALPKIAKFDEEVWW